MKYVWFILFNLDETKMTKILFKLYSSNVIQCTLYVISLFPKIIIMMLHHYYNYKVKNIDGCQLIYIYIYLV